MFKAFARLATRNEFADLTKGLIRIFLPDLRSPFTEFALGVGKLEGDLGAGHELRHLHAQPSGKGPAKINFIKALADIGNRDGVDRFP